MNFPDLQALSGMTRSETAEYLGVSTDMVRQWLNGRMRAPEGAISELTDLVSKIELTALGHDWDLPYDSCYKEAKKIQLRRGK